MTSDGDDATHVIRLRGPWEWATEDGSSGRVDIESARDAPPWPTGARVTLTRRFGHPPLGDGESARVRLTAIAGDAAMTLDGKPFVASAPLTGTPGARHVVTVGFTASTEHPLPFDTAVIEIFAELTTRKPEA